MRASSNYMPPEQFEQLISAIPSLHIRKWRSEDIAMMFRICYWCGLRISECVRLKAEDFELDMKRVYLGQTKTRKEDRATIPDMFLPEITLYLAGKKGELFPGLNRFIVAYWLKKLGESLEIPALTAAQSKTGEKTKCHIFRKSIGKDMIYGTRDGRKMPLNVVQKKLRHTNLDMTSRYLKVEDEDVLQAGW